VEAQDNNTTHNGDERAHTQRIFFFFFFLKTRFWGLFCVVALSIMRFVFLLVALVACGASKSVSGVSDSPAQRATDMLSRMSLRQKISLLHGTGNTYPYVGMLSGVPELGIPSLHLEDGPQGVADGALQATCFPSALTVAHSWDADLFYTYSRAMGREQRAKGSHVMLGPMVNLARVPQGGRNFESLGEDPHLASVMAQSSVQGIQSAGVMANVKHFICNNQETDRTSVSSNVDATTLYELYLQPFKAAVDAGVLSVMCSYNKINNVYACENEETLGFYLKGLLGFKYFVVSDWGGTHSTVLAANSGLDIEMPGSTYFGDKLYSAVQNGQVLPEVIDDKAYRVLLAMYTAGIFDNPPKGNINSTATSQEHALLSRRLAEESAVLLKNANNILPLQLSKLSKIAVIGDFASEKYDLVAGGGSGHVKAMYKVSALQGIQNWTSGSHVQVIYAGNDQSKAVAAAREADVVVVVVAAFSTEGADRSTLGFGATQDALVSAVAAANMKTIVVLHNPGAVLTPWKDSVSAILALGYPGQEDGNALARILFGQVNPSGRLAVTWPASDTQSGLTKAQWPGINKQANYTEGLLIGYRYYRAKSVVPNFPFGFGLSYSNFSYTNFNVVQNSEYEVIFTGSVVNTSPFPGATVVQLYVSFPNQYNRPLQLKGFQKVQVPANGGVVDYSISVNPQTDFLIWDANASWPVKATGTYTAYFALSSEQFIASKTFDV
jgi:beta-glucosidase